MISQRWVTILPRLHRLPSDEIENQHSDHHPDKTEPNNSRNEVSGMLRTASRVPVGHPRDGDPLDGDDGGVEPPGGVVTDEEGWDSGTAGLWAGEGGVERSQNIEWIVFLREEEERAGLLHLEGSLDTGDLPLPSSLLSPGDKLKCDISPQSSSSLAPDQGERLGISFLVLVNWELWALTLPRPPSCKLIDWILLRTVELWSSPSWMEWTCWAGSRSEVRRKSAEIWLNTMSSYHHFHLNGEARFPLFVVQDPGGNSLGIFYHWVLLHSFGQYQNTTNHFKEHFTSEINYNKNQSETLHSVQRSGFRFTIATAVFVFINIQSAAVWSEVQYEGMRWMMIEL